MEKKELCSIIRDLLPSYVEKLTNEETNKFIETHIEECPECKKLLENIKKEIEIDAPKNEEKQFKYIKRYSKRLKLLRNILLIIAFIFILIVARRFIILIHLDTKAITIQESNNYYIKLEYRQDEEIILAEKYNKNQISLTKLKMYDVTDLNNNTNYIHYKTNVENLYFINNSQQDNKLDLQDNLSVDITNYTLDFKTLFKKLFVSITTSIQKVKLKEKDCYLIKFQNKEKFIDANNGLVLKVIDNDNNKVVDYHYEFNTVTDEDVAMPDTTGYTIIDE